MSIMESSKKSLDQLSRDIEEKIAEWEEREGIELTDVHLDRIGVYNYAGSRGSIVKIRCRAEISSR